MRYLDDVPKIPAAAISTGNAVGPVAVGEGDVTLAHIEKAVVRDRRAVGVTGQVVEHLLGPAEGRLAEIGRAHV